MRTAITIGVPHDSDKYEVVTGPEVSYQDQKVALKGFKQTLTHPKYRTLEVVTASGDKHKFSKPAETVTKEAVGKEVHPKRENPVAPQTHAPHFPHTQKHKHL